MGLLNRNHLVLHLILIFSASNPVSANTHYAEENVPIVVQSVPPCHLYGDSDIYGIGIRLSLYIQWAAMILALILGGEPEIRATRQGFSVVSLAVLINTYISVSHGSFAILELYIVSCLVVFLSGHFIIPFGGGIKLPETPIRQWTIRLFLDKMKEWRPKLFELEPFQKDPIGIGFLVLIDTAFLLSQPWLYFVILNQGHKPGCTAKIYVVFTYVDVYSHSWVSFLKASAILSVILAVFFGIFGFYAIIYGIVKPGRADTDDPARGVRGGYQGMSTEGGAAPPLHHRRNFGEIIKHLPTVLLENVQGNFIRLFFAVVGSFFIVFVEKTLQVDGIDLSNAPLTSTSQLLPFLVGVFTAASVVWESVRKLSSGVGTELAHLHWYQNVRQWSSRV